jgi:hypothetical protein
MVEHQILVLAIKVRFLYPLNPPHLAARKGEMCKRKIKQYEVKASINKKRKL